MTQAPLLPPDILYEGYHDAAGTPLAAPLRREEAAGMGADLGAAFAAPCIITGQATSSFDIAWALDAQQGLPAWASVVCRSQTGGRGQLRRQWHSPPGNVYVSFFLPEGVARLHDMASLYVGWLVREGLAAMNIATALKWPNDVLLHLPGGNEGKFGGLLLEERQGRLLAGLGLNLVNAPSNDVMRADKAIPAASLPAYDGTPCAFWRDLADNMRARYTCGPDLEQPDDVRRAVAACLAWQGRRVHADEPDCDGILDGLEADGSLRLLTAKGLLVVRSGSIRLVG